MGIFGIDPVNARLPIYELDLSSRQIKNASERNETAARTWGLLRIQGRIALIDPVRLNNVRSIDDEKLASFAGLAMLAVSGNLWAACSDIGWNALNAAVNAAAAAGGATGGYGLNMWASVVDETGAVCWVTTNGTPGASAGNSEWLGSRVISAQKANTANAFSLDGYAISTANLYSAVQPGGSSMAFRPATLSMQRSLMPEVPPSSARSMIRCAARKSVASMSSVVVSRSMLTVRKWGHWVYPEIPPAATMLSPGGSARRLACNRVV